MEYDDDARVFNFITGLACGMAIGVGVALLMAPESGKRTRRRIHRAAEDLRVTAADRWDELSDDVRGRVDEALQGARRKFS